MYKLLGRPHLEYAAPVWNPHLIKNISKLENVQTFALKMCHKNWEAGYQICIPTLENRRLYLKLCTLYKIIYGYFYFPPNALYLSQVDFFKIHPPYTNLLPTSIICSHHLFPEPFQFGTLFPTLLSLLLILLPLGHMLHPLLAIICFLTLYTQFFCIFYHSTHSVCN